MPDAPVPSPQESPAKAQVAASGESAAGNVGNPEEGAGDADVLTMFPHSQTAPWWVSGQANVIMQWHGRFAAEYSGPNSLTPWSQSATTHVATLYTGLQITPTTELFLDGESATGGGIGGALGLAGYTNLDSVRTVSGVALSRAPYIARAMVRQIIPLSDDKVEEDRDQFHLATSVAARRIEIRFGKFDTADFFDLNTYGSDSHLQFMNWTVDNNGAYDYAANTRGYTDGAVIEYDDHWFSVRFGEMLMPKEANGIYLDADVARARAANLEFEARGKVIAHRAGVVRVLSYLNQANMGNYEQAVAEYLDGQTPTPNIIATRREGRHRYGFGLNFEQELTSWVAIFGRVGWSDGRNESYCYTEDDRTVELGGYFPGATWHRKNDRAGVAFVANGIVRSHQEYLKLGGLGFLLGDGGLTNGAEQIVEGFYTAHVWRGLFVSYDLQHVTNPGYNEVRGPVTVEGVRAHVDF
jgi:hypothetical protein